MVYKCLELANWDGPYNVFVVPDDAWASQSGWAPEVHEYGGRFYLFTTLHNRDKILAEPPEVVETTYARGTIIAVGDSPDGPFVPVRNGPIPPDDLMTLDDGRVAGALGAARPAGRR
jgi:hypothetical protein